MTDDSLDWCMMSNASLGYQAQEHSKVTTERRVCRIIIVMVLMTSDEGALGLRVGARES